MSRRNFAKSAASIGQVGEVFRAELIGESKAKFENRCNSRVGHSVRYLRIACLVSLSLSLKIRLLNAARLPWSEHWRRSRINRLSTGHLDGLVMLIEFDFVESNDGATAATT